MARELGLGAVQVWQALSEASGRGRGSQEVTIVFTDLVEFSSWALSAGDDAVLSLLRDVARTVEPAMEARGGRIVKRLGDGLMAVFDDPAAGVAAAREACASVAQLEFDGHRPALRAGVHTEPRRRLRQHRQPGAGRRRARAGRPADARPAAAAQGAAGAGPRPAGAADRARGAVLGLRPLPRQGCAEGPGGVRGRAGLSRDT